MHYIQGLDSTSKRSLTCSEKSKRLRIYSEIELRYAYDCETKLAEKGLSQMINHAGAAELRAGLTASI